VPDGGFNGDASFWVNMSGGTVALSRSSLDVAGCSSSGSLEYTYTGPTNTDGPVWTACIPIASNVSYNVGGWVYLPSSGGGSVYGSVDVNWFTDTNCANLNVINSNWGVTTPVDMTLVNTWQYSHLDNVVPYPGTKAALFGMQVESNQNGRLAQAYFDSLYFTPAPGRF
jgi:hypothetical protein